MVDGQTPHQSPLEMEADRAAAGGDRLRARKLLEQVISSNPSSMDPWLKLAAVCRADGDVLGALTAVAGALRLEPLAFLPLLLKANLLEATGQPDEAGEAYGHALAQKPDEIPAHLAEPIARAERSYAEYVGRLERRLLEVGRQFSRKLGEREKRRLARFTSNVTRRTKPWHCEPTHFHYPGLSECEFHDREDFPWLEALEAETPVILEEFNELMAGERAELVPYIQYSDDQPLGQWRDLNWNRDWTAVHLFLNGLSVEANARHCPRTLQVLARIGQPDIAGKSPNAMFSLLAPRTHIPPHHGVANTRLVCHLPLIVPDSCTFRVGAETREWKVGRAFVFDDTIEHEAVNNSDQLRVVFIFDVWHPGLTTTEREAVAAIMGHASASGESGL